MEMLLIISLKILDGSLHFADLSDLRLTTVTECH
jgi:hypothetical protein